MAKRLYILASVGVLMAALSASAGPFSGVGTRSAYPPAGPIPWEQLSPALQADIRAVMDRPTLFGQGPSDTFACRPEHYFYFLDHPDRAVTAWRRLGAKCVSINDLGNGWFGCDDQGSQVNWQTVYRDSEKRVWYAQGKVKPGPLLMSVPVRVVVILYHSERPSANGQQFIEQHSDIYVHTDSKFTALITKMLGSSAPRMAEQGLGQLQMFFSALSTYMERNPNSVDSLMRTD